PKPADIVGRKPWTMYVLLRAYQARALPPVYPSARTTSASGHGVPRRTASPRTANTLEGSGSSANRMGNAGSASAAAGTRERMRIAPVMSRTGLFGNRTRRMTRTWDIIKTKKAQTIRRLNSGQAEDAGRHVGAALAP